MTSPVDPDDPFRPSPGPDDSNLGSVPFDFDRPPQPPLAYGPGPKRPRRRWPYVVGGLALIVVLIGVLGVVWFQRQVDPPGPPGEAVSITVAKGASTSNIADLLEARGIVASARAFRAYVRLNGADTIEAGQYSLRRNDSLSNLLTILEGGAVPEDLGVRLTVPEGLTLAQTADRVGRVPGRTAAAFLALANGGTIRSNLQPAGSGLEGLIFPDTYFVTPTEDEAKILTRMVGSFDRLATELDITGGAARLGITPYQVVVVASLVEREARVDDDRAKVARVIYNRLAAKMRLQIDATVQFALGEQKDRILNKDLEIDSPYNTYRIAGLPPGPIAAPGRKALEAALNPEPGPWIYYVLANADGHHAFTDSAAEFGRLLQEATRKGLR